MSSKISTIYDAIVTRLGVVFPNHTRLSSSYQLELNPEDWLSLGYALQINSGANSNLHVGCILDIERTVTVAITREFKALELDVGPKATTEKDLLEDQYLLINDFEKVFSLNDPSVSAFQFVSDSGIQSVFPDKNSFLKIESIFRIKYWEDLN